MSLNNKFLTLLRRVMYRVTSSTAGIVHWRSRVWSSFFRGSGADLNGLKPFFSVGFSRWPKNKMSGGHVLADGSRRRTIYFRDTSGYSRLRFGCAECIGCHRRSRNKPSITDELIRRCTLDVRYIFLRLLSNARSLRPPAFFTPTSSTDFDK